MTLVFGCIGLTIAMMIGSVTGAIARVAANRAHAQAAADAIALAVVAESGPYGDSRPGEVATRYAEANGAELVECSCAPGAMSVQVTAAVGGVDASARAVLDPRLLQAGIEGDSIGLHPVLAAAVDQLLTAGNGSITLVSGFRTHARQSELWSEAIRRYGDPEIADDWVARPGSSMHEQGLAVDLGGDLELALRSIAELDLPLYRPLRNEPWHFELLGSRN